MSAQCRTLTCIRCPRGCQGEVEAVGTEGVGGRGNSCKRGEVYARAEIAAPVRTVTSTVPAIGSATERMVSVKTSREVPKDKVMEVMAEIRRARVHAPVRIGDVIVADVAGTGADVVATKSA